MHRLNFTLDDATARLLDELAARYYHGNKSLAVRAALESLAAHFGAEGWRVSGYIPTTLDASQCCHTCGETHASGEVLYRPVFKRGGGPASQRSLPAENWLDCAGCVEETTSLF